jgi:hypothetical protein
MMAGHFHKFVSMRRTPEEKVEEAVERVMPVPMDIPDVPYGLCISLTETELEKLDLDEDCECGDTIHLFALAQVTSVSKRDTGNGSEIRVELSITDLALESEGEENEPD